MITLYGIKLNQKGCTLYLTSATVEDFNNWMDAGYITADIWKREITDGYQRTPDERRFRKIAEYLEGKMSIEETLLRSCQ